MGEQRFIPILSQRTIVREINIERIKKIVIEASEQSNRISVPEINKPELLKNFLSQFPKNGSLIFCDIVACRIPNFIMSRIETLEGGGSGGIKFGVSRSIRVVLMSFASICF